MTNRREFLKDLAGAAGIVFVGCPWVEAAASALQAGGTGRRREVAVGGRRIRTVDVHCHCYVDDVWDLIKDQPQARTVRNVLQTPVGQNLHLANVNERLRYMDEWGIDVQAVSLGMTYLHYWAERDLARQIMKVQN